MILYLWSDVLVGLCLFGYSKNVKGVRKHINVKVNYKPLCKFTFLVFTGGVDYVFVFLDDRSSSPHTFPLFWGLSLFLYFLLILLRCNYSSSIEAHSATSINVVTDRVSLFRNLLTSPS